MSVRLHKSKRETRIGHLVSHLLDWFAANARDLPWRRTHDPYAIWVSEIMLQQTQVITVIPYWQRWMRELPTVKAVAKASPAKIHKLWEGLGYYTRVRNLQKAALVVIDKHGGRFPSTFDDVFALPGIGRYTAGAICSIAFNQPTPILDGNVIRVLTRVFGMTQNPKEKQTNVRLWQLAEELVGFAKNATATKNNSPSHISRPSREIYSCSHLNQSLMELGALICTPRNPQCAICPVKQICIAFKEHRIEDLPNLGKRETATSRHFIAFAIERGGKFLVRQRPANVVNAHLWEFPNVEVNGGHPDAKMIFQHHFKAAPEKIQALCKVKHSITRYRILLEVFSVKPGKSPASTAGIWKTPAQMKALAFSSAHRKAYLTLTTKDRS